MEEINEALMKYCLTTQTNTIFNSLKVGGSIKKVFNSDDQLKRHIWFLSETPANHLLVAHLDTVTALDTQLYMHTANDMIFNKGLDDRLGLYTCLYLQDKYGCFDILLTDNEEMGRSTAGSFNCPDYRCIYEFDRGGLDQFVMYNPCKSLSGAITKQTDFEEKRGSYSDIADIDTDTASVNWCVAYRDYHSDKSHVFISEYMFCISTFEDFFEKTKYITYTKDPAVSTNWNQYKRRGKNSSKRVKKGSGIKPAPVLKPLDAQKKEKLPVLLDPDKTQRIRLKDIEDKLSDQDEDDVIDVEQGWDQGAEYTAEDWYHNQGYIGG